MLFYFRNNGEPKWESYTIENNNWNSVIIFFKKRLCAMYINELWSKYFSKLTLFAKDCGRVKINNTFKSMEHFYTRSKFSFMISTLGTQELCGQLSSYHLQSKDSSIRQIEKSMKENKKNSFIFSLMTFLLPVSSPSSSPNSQMFLFSIPHIFSYFVSSVHDNER